MPAFFLSPVCWDLVNSLANGLCTRVLSMEDLRPGQGHSEQCPLIILCSQEQWAIELLLFWTYHV
jgi:hypothetical protein